MTNGLTQGQALTEAAARLERAGVETARLDARLLLGLATGTTQEAVIGHPERVLGADALAQYREYVERRARREPLAYVTGEKEFWGLHFAVGPQTLIPRPDSETLVAEVLRRFPDRGMPLRILDLGTGSGCLLLALLTEFLAARGVGVDINPGAVAQARMNAERLGLSERAQVMQGRWTEGLSGRFDVIVSNPPYIPAADVLALEPEVAQYEPRLALEGGADGLACYREIAAEAGGVLEPGGLIALEIGAGQGPDVREIFTHAGFADAGSASDLAGIERCVFFTNKRNEHA